MLLKCLGVPPSYEWEVHGLSLDQIYPALQSKRRFPGFEGSVPVFKADKKKGAPLPDPEIESQRSLLLGICLPWIQEMDGSPYLLQWLSESIPVTTNIGISWFINPITIR